MQLSDYEVWRLSENTSAEDLISAFPQSPEADSLYERSVRRLLRRLGDPDTTFAVPQSLPSLMQHHRLSRKECLVSALSCDRGRRHQPKSSPFGTTPHYRRFVNSKPLLVSRSTIPVRRQQCRGRYDLDPVHMLESDGIHDEGWHDRTMTGARHSIRAAQCRRKHRSPPTVPGR